MRVGVPASSQYTLKVTAYGRLPGICTGAGLDQWPMGGCTNRIPAVSATDGALFFSGSGTCHISAPSIQTVMDFWCSNASQYTLQVTAHTIFIGNCTGAGLDVLAPREVAPTEIPLFLQPTEPDLVVGVWYMPHKRPPNGCFHTR